MRIAFGKPSKASFEAAASDEEEALYLEAETLAMIEMSKSMKT